MTSTVNLMATTITSPPSHLSLSHQPLQVYQRHRTPIRNTKEPNRRYLLFELAPAFLLLDTEQQRNPRDGNTFTTNVAARVQAAKAGRRGTRSTESLACARERAERPEWHSQQDANEDRSRPSNWRRER